MPRPEKVQAVADIKVRLEEARAVFLAEYAGLSVSEQQTLRRELRASDAEFKVVKMTLARRAAAELELDELDELLLGPTGLAYADGDPVGAAKVLRDFAKDHDVFTVKGGFLGRDFLTPERIAELASLGSREVLLAKIAGVLEAPLAGAAALFAAMPRTMANMMQQLLEQKEREVPEASTESEDVAAPRDEPAANEASTDEASTDEASTEEPKIESSQQDDDADPEAVAEGDEEDE